jgi:CBS domain-containing protein
MPQKEGTMVDRAPLQVENVMETTPQMIQGSQALLTARQRMQGMMGVKSLIVVDEAGQFLGMVRYNDIDRAATAGATVSDVMLSGVPAVHADQAVQELAGVMTEYDIDRLPVVDESNTVIGELPRSAVTLAESRTGEAVTGRERLSDAMSDQVSPTLDVREDMTVVGSSGHKIGKVKEVLADSLGGSLTHVVVHTGLIFGKDKSIPADLIDHVEGDEVSLKVDKSDVDMLPDLNATG